MKLFVTCRWPIMLSGIFASLLSAAYLQAAEAAPETIMVIGQQANDAHSLNNVDLSQYTGFAKVVEREQFADRFTTMPELLNQMPSVQVKSLGGIGSNASLSIRGSSGKQVNIFLDGLLLNSAFTGTADLQTIPSVLVERIEAYPDFTPINLSNANLAGAVNFRSRALKANEVGGQLSLAYGSFSTEQQALSLWADVDGWQLIASANHSKAENDYPVSEDIFRSTSTTRENDQYHGNSSFIKLAKEFEQLRVQLLIQNASDRKHLATPTNLPTDRAYFDSDSSRVQSVIDYQLGLWRFSHRLFYAEEDNLYNDEYSSVGLGQNETQTNQEAVGLFNMASVLWASHELIASLDLRQDKIQQEDVFSPDTVDGDRNSLVFALADNWMLTEHWLVNLTGRYYQITEDMQYSDKLSDAEADYSASTWQLGSRYQWFDPLTLKINLGSSIRVPSLTEKFGSSGLYEGNPDLKVEQADAIDVGFSFNLAAVTLNSSLFYKKIHDGIFISYDSRGVGHPENVSESILSGVEAELIIRPLSWLEINSNATFLDSENESPVKAYKGKQLPGIYHDNAGLGIAFFTSNWRWATNYQFYDGLYYNGTNSVAADSQNMLNSSLTRYFKYVSIDFTARNLLNENVMSYNRMPTPGRAYIATLNIDF